MTRHTFDGSLGVSNIVQSRDLLKALKKLSLIKFFIHIYMLSNVLVLQNSNNHPDYANGVAIIVPKVDYILLPWFAMNLFINERTFVL